MDTKTRNWQKARLLGFNLDTKVLSPIELVNYRLALHYLGLIKESWDNETEKLIGHELKPYKCYLCGRRSNVAHLVDIGQGHTQNYYKKHFKEHQEV